MGFLPTWSMDAIRSSLLIHVLGKQGSGRRIIGEDDLRGGSEIRSAVAGVGVIGAESIYTGSMSSPSPSALMTQEIDLTMKIWLGCGRDEEPTEKAILFDEETTR